MRFDTIRFIKNEKGGAELIETIFALQIILILTFGMIFFISAAREDVIIESAARTGAREYGITGSTQDAIAKAKEELRLGGVDANVNFSGNEIVVSKPIKFTVPFLENYNFGLKKKSLFYRETDSWYYDKEPYRQGSPVNGYSGYTGNPYR